jgi:NADP-dependent 3-hydroxy acid dehydrogenase YdfG
MAIKLKQLRDQVIVLTGASSGIGLTTARIAAKRGARLVLAARNEEALEQLVAEIRQGGGEAIGVVADVGSEEAVSGLARAAVARYGGFDTWVNNAGVTLFGWMDVVATEDHRRLFETNFWGVVYGSLEAVRHLRERGGALINLGSIAGDRAVPLQGMYSASKHAVKGFTDALRMELAAVAAPISVSLIKPASIDTPIPQHARNYLDEEPRLPQPLYAPELVAEAILHCAEHPRRDVIVGGSGKAITTLGLAAPRVADQAMQTRAFLNQEKTGEPPREPGGALYAPTFGLHERGEHPGPVRETSLYTKAALHPLLTGALVIGVGLAAAAVARRAANGENH